MIDISFEINGYTVRPNQLGNELEKAALEAVRKDIERMVGNIRDPKTGQRPKIKVKGRSLDNLSFEVSGSEDLIEKVKKKLG